MGPGGFPYPQPSCGLPWPSPESSSSCPLRFSSRSPGFPAAGPAAETSSPGRWRGSLTRSSSAPTGAVSTAIPRSSFGWNSHSGFHRTSRPCTCAEDPMIGSMGSAGHDLPVFLLLRRLPRGSSGGGRRGSSKRSTEPLWTRECCLHFTLSWRWRPSPGSRRPQTMRETISTGGSARRVTRPAP